MALSRREWGNLVPLDSSPLAVASLPGLVAGPVLRRLTRTAVSVWAACVAPDAITLRVRRHTPGTPLMGPPMSTLRFDVLEEIPEIRATNVPGPL